MQIETRIRSIDLVSALRSYIERRVYFAVGRFDHLVERVTVRVNDLNGPRGGIDQCCRVRVDLIPAGHIDAREVHEDLWAAVDGAADKVGRSIARELSRIRDARTGNASVSIKGNADLRKQLCMRTTRIRRWALWT